MDTLTVKQWKVMINNDIFFFSATNEETPSLVTNGFSGKSKFNKFLLFILLVFLSNRFKLKSEINKKLIWSIGTLIYGKKKQLNLPRVHEIVWNIWKLKKFFVCVWICRLRYLLISINGHSYFSVALFELFFWKTATTNLIRIFNAV